MAAQITRAEFTKATDKLDQLDKNVASMQSVLDDIQKKMNIGDKSDGGKRSEGEEKSDAENKSQEEGKHYRSRYASREEKKFKIDELLDWFYEVESFFDFMDVPERTHVKLVAYKLKGGSAAWWYKVGEDRKNFGARLVDEYVSEFYSLIARNELKESDEQLVARFIEGLNRVIQEGMTQTVYTMDEAIQQAVRIERRVFGATKFPVKQSPKFQGNFRTSPSYYNYSEISSCQDDIPGRQQFRSTNFTNSPTPKNPSHILPIPLEFQSVQPSQATTSIPSSQEDLKKYNGLVNDTSRESEESDVDETIEVDEVGQMYGDHYIGVIRPLLFFKSSYSQRNSIFKTKCSLGGKIVDMIIDSRSMDNYIAVDVVKNLGLPVTPHPQPYFVVWVNSFSSENITHKCLVRFSFIGYIDEVLCDVINMNAAHLLLGRPWQYDVRVVRNCFENTYTFYKDGKKKVVIPSRSVIVYKEHSDGKTSALVASIVKSLHSQTLSSHEVFKAEVEIPTRIQSLLQQ
ncbi:uncharacterized protein LOC113312976 [Papaver somniferum]|uniref:uncharacterized protein LOC113312976 n=1 Tax=Papaver somniferum TaxID=3469 RepID=UPI000E6F620F|nr:uncharacterized protein LOC113312976 [Papaver somniferum]